MSFQVIREIAKMPVLLGVTNLDKFRGSLEANHSIFLKHNKENPALVIKPGTFSYPAFPTLL